MIPVLVALGANVGDPIKAIREAFDLLRELGDLRAESGLYASEPMYLEDQPEFVNAAALLETSLGPLRLLQALKQIEAAIGRQERQRNGPREIDLDIIAYGALRLDSPNLRIPHPRLAERRFVLEPLAQVAPDFFIPGCGSPTALLRAPEVQAQTLRKL